MLKPPVEYKPSVQQPRWFDKFNPVWWFQDITKPQGVPYLDWSAWSGKLGGKFWTYSWGIRNPMHNFNAFIIGVEGKFHTFQGSKTSEGIFAPNGGSQWGVVRCKGWIPLPLFSYKGEKVEWCIGWKPLGYFDISRRVANAKDWTNKD